MVSPSENKTVKLTMEGLRRRLSKPRNSCSPITPEHIQQMVQRAGLDNLQDLRVTAFVLLSFAGFFRCSEVCAIRTEHILVKSTHIEIYVPGSKNDQFKQGQTVYIAKTGKGTCPVSMLLKYVAKAGIDLDSPQFVFRNVQHYKGAIRITTVDAPITYSRINELVKQKFKDLGLDCKLYKLHSLRVGGSSAAANNQVPDRAFQRHGRWRTVSVKNSYITESMSDLLSVSKNLGI
jgi:integrase